MADIFLPLSEKPKWVEIDKVKEAGSQLEIERLRSAPESEKVYPALEIASACMKSNGRFGDPTSFDVSLVTEGDKNGYLKRDLELRPFLKAVEKLCSECEQKEIHDVEWGMVNAVLIEFKNLKPLKAE